MIDPGTLIIQTCRSRVELHRGAKAQYPNHFRDLERYYKEKSEFIEGKDRKGEGEPGAEP